MSLKQPENIYFVYRTTQKQGVSEKGGARSKASIWTRADIVVLGLFPISSRHMLCASPHKIRHETLAITLSPDDDELLKRTLHFIDPHALSDTLDVKPEDWQEGEIIGSYFHFEEGPGGSRLNGMKCIFGHPHMKGYILRPPSGHLFCVGHECGQTHFNADAWDDERSKIDQEKNRQGDLRKLLALEGRLTPLKRALEGYHGKGRLMEARKRVMAFRDHFSALLNEVDSNGNLLIYREEEDFAATQRIKQKFEDRIEAVERRKEIGAIDSETAASEINHIRDEIRKVKPVVRWVKVPSGRQLPDYNKFMAAENTPYRINGAIVEVSNLISRIEGTPYTGQLTDYQLKTLVRDIKAAILELDDYTDVLKGLNSFISSASIATMRSWAADRKDLPEITGTASEGYTVSSKTDRQPFRVPPPLTTEPCKEVAEIKELLAELERVVL